MGPVGGGVPDDFSVRLRATLVPPESGAWKFSVVQAGRARVLLDGEVFLDNWNPTERGEAFYGMGSAELAQTVDLVAGRRYELVVEAIPAAPALGGLSVGLEPPAADDLIERAVAVARTADAVVCVVGSDGQWETEGNDRESMTLPGAQDELVHAVAAVNPRTIVVVNAASPVAMPWAGDVAAVLQCWFAGEEWGNALADVLSGDVAPSGKLPTTIPMRIEDTPAYAHYPGADGKVHYDGRRVRRLSLVRRAADRTPLLLRSRPLVHDVRHRGSHVDADERHAFGADRGPRHEHGRDTWRRSRAVLRRRSRVERAAAAPGAEGVRQGRGSNPASRRTVALQLDERAFAFWDDTAHDWCVEAGEFELRIGTSSRDIRRRATISFD